MGWLDQRSSRVCAGRKNAIRQGGPLRGAGELKGADERRVDGQRNTLGILGLRRQRRRHLLHHGEKARGIEAARLGRLTRELRQQRGGYAAASRVVAVLRRQIGRENRLKAAGSEGVLQPMRLIVQSRRQAFTDELGLGLEVRIEGPVRQPGVALPVDADLL